MLEDDGQANGGEGGGPVLELSKPKTRLYKVGAIVLATVLLICLALVLYMHYGRQQSSGATAGEILRGTPIKVDDTAIRAQAKQDISPLLTRDYPAFYATLGYKMTTAGVQARQDFQASMDSLKVTGGCAFAADKITKQQGTGLDGRPNIVILAGPVTCLDSAYRLELEYTGNGGHPEVFKPYKLTVTADAVGFSDAVLHSSNVRGHFTATDKSTPPHVLYLTAKDRATVDSFIKDDIAGSNCVLSSNVSASIELTRALGGDAFLAGIINYQAVCDSIKTRS